MIKKMSLLMLGFTLSTSVFAETAKKEMDPKMAEQMAIWQKAATLSESHNLLKNYAGHWKYTSKWWASATSPVEESTGTSKNKMLFGDRYVQMDVSGKSMGQPFMGLSIAGYDNLKKEYQTIWIDNMGTGIMKTSGQYDAATKTLKESGMCPGLDGKKEKPFRSETVFTSKTSMTFTMYMTGDDGKEFKSMEMIYIKTK